MITLFYGLTFPRSMARILAILLSKPGYIVGLSRKGYGYQLKGLHYDKRTTVQ